MKIPARLLLLLCTLLVATTHAGDDAAAFEREIAERGRSWNTESLGKAVDRYGSLAAGARDTRGSIDALRALRDSGELLHQRVRDHVRALEAECGEDEAALERLYRSEDWYLLNRALAGVRYWQSWLDLGIAETTPEPDARIMALGRAERGFQATAVRILYPGLVYGSWLGLAYVEEARGEHGEAKRRLELLAQALASDPENPLREIVRNELALIDARSGSVTSELPPAGRRLEAVEARRLREEAFALLAARRKSMQRVTVIGAGERLGRLIADGYLDDALLDRMLDWREELVGADVGTMSLLVDAEYAYAHAQYETTVLKYRAFAAAGGFDLQLDLALYRYHYAVALQQLGYAREGLRVAEQLRGDARLGAKAAKLRFLLAQQLVSSGPGKAGRGELEDAAREFLRAMPKDRDAPLAHAVLANAAEGSESRAAHLEAARGDSRLAETVAQLRLEGLLDRFARAGRDGNWPARGEAARAVLLEIEKLPRDRRRAVEMRVLGFQMRVAAGEPTGDLAKELPSLLAEAGADANLQRLLAWGRLRLYDTERPGESWSANIEAIGRDATGSAMELELFAYVQETRQRAEPSVLLDLCRMVKPVFASRPATRRHLLLIEHAALTALDRHADALALAAEMVGEFPDSGNGWLAYAESAERAGDALSAERAWATIGAAEPQGSPRWIEASARRIAALQVSAQMPELRCTLFHSLANYRARMDAGMKERVDALRAGENCAATGE